VRSTRTRIAARRLNCTEIDRRSPGVVYPALTYLEEMGFAVSEAEENRKLYEITDSGKEHLAKNREPVDETLEQLSRFGRRISRVQKHFAEEEAENDFEYESCAPRETNGTN
jgi:DNA-binding PadR family transcriptional regulator